MIRLVSVPFRGSCSEIWLLLVFFVKIALSFRPLSGFVFWNPIGTYVIELFSREFPSPFGVRVLKSSSRSLALISFSLSFRPLSGFVFWNKEEQLKLQLLDKAGFRPLSGFTFWNPLDGKGESRWCKVSVPFRGSRSEIDASQGCSISSSVKFPSPFGVHVLK